MGSGIIETVLSSAKSVVRIVAFLNGEFQSQVLVAVLEDSPVVGSEDHYRVVQDSKRIKTGYGLAYAPIGFDNGITPWA